MKFNFRGKKYRWNYEQFLINLGYFILFALVVIGYLIVAKMDFNSYIGK